MKLGMVSLWGEDLNLFRARLREAESLGYDLSGVGDFPPGDHDPHISLALVTQDIKRNSALGFETIEQPPSPQTMAAETAQSVQRLAKIVSQLQIEMQ